MQKIYLALAFVASAIATLCVAAPVAKHLFGEQAIDNPTAQLTSKVCEMRFDPEQNFAYANFRIENKGDRRLIVNAHEFGCDCFVKSTGSLLILGGKSQTLRLPISTEAMRHNDWLALELRTNDPQNQSIPIRIRVLGRPGGLDEVASPADDAEVGCSNRPPVLSTDLES